MYGLLIKLYFKRSISLFISLVLVLLVSFTLLFAINHFLPAANSLTVAWVSTDQEVLTKTLLNSITENSTDFQLIEMPEAEARQGLEEGRFVAVIRIPEQSGERLNRGEDLVVDVQYAAIPAVLRERLSYFVNQFIYSLNRAQAETELCYDLLAKHSSASDETMAGIFPDAVISFATAFLARSQALESIQVESVASALHWSAYIVHTLILLFIFFSSQLLSQTLAKDWKDGLAQRLARHRGARWAFMICSSFTQLVLLGALFFGLLLIGKSRINLPQDFPVLFLFLIAVIFTNNTVAVYLADKNKAIELHFIISLVLLFISGLLLPLSFFPSFIYRFALLSPFSRMHQYLLYQIPYSLWPFFLALALLLVLYELISRRALQKGGAVLINKHAGDGGELP